MKQLSIFLENREGRLQEVFKLLEEADINIISLSLAETDEYGMLRLLVSDPEKGKAYLRENGVSCKLTDVVTVKLEHRVGSLQKPVNVLFQAGINIEYMYALSTGTDDAAIAIKPSDFEGAVKALKEMNMEFFE